VPADTGYCSFLRTKQEGNVTCRRWFPRLLVRPAVDVKCKLFLNIRQNKQFIDHVYSSGSSNSPCSAGEHLSATAAAIAKRKHCKYLFLTQLTGMEGFFTTWKPYVTSSELRSCQFYTSYHF